MRAFLLTILLGAGAGCNTPSVPIPPPLLSALKFADGPAAGQAVLNGTPVLQHADARFSIYNSTQGQGVIITAAHDGSFTSPPFAGADGDLVDIDYVTATGEESGVDCVSLHVGIALFTTLCE